MHAQRKLQLAAALVIANGIVAVQFMPDTAIAATCSAPGPAIICDHVFYCAINDPHTSCTIAAPAGCTATAAYCIGGICDALGQPYVYCVYE